MTTEPLPQPWARWMSPDGVARHHARGNRCDTRRCQEKAVIQTLRRYRAEGRIGWDERFFCAPHGRAWAGRHHVEIGPALLTEAPATPEGPVPWPVVWRLHPDDVAWNAAEGKRCETRKCGAPAVAVTWRWWRSRAVGRTLLGEHEVCLAHAREFADRHGVRIEPPPDEPSRRAGTGRHSLEDR
jgi:hypothetical protein